MQVGAQDCSMRAPDFPERVVLDVELLDNLYIRNADYGVVALNTNYLLNELASYQTLKSGNSVAIFNALYRNYSFRDIKSPWWSEVSDAALRSNSPKHWHMQIPIVAAGLYLI